MSQTPISRRLFRSNGPTARPFVVDLSHSQQCVTDGGTDRPEADHQLDIQECGQSSAGSVCVVDDTNRLAAISEPLAEQVGADRSLVGRHLSAVLSAGSDIDTRLDEIRQQLREPAVSTVRSTDCQLRTPEGRTSRTPDGQATRTVEWAIYTGPESGSAADSTEWLVGTVRPEAVEIDHTQPSANPSRFRELFKQLPDPVAEVQFREGEPYVTSINPAFESTFGYDEHELVGEPLNEYIVPASADADATELDREAADGEWTAGEVIREAADGQRLFLFRGIPFRHNGQQCGFGVYTDVTDRESQQRYHEVLNRLLRHNLRNDLNVILGLADQLTTDSESTNSKSTNSELADSESADSELADSESADSEPADSKSADSESTEVGERLKQRALDLVETTRRARELESVIDRSATDSRPIAIHKLIAVTADQLAETYPERQLTHSIEQPAVGLAGPPLQEAVIELVENAVEHTTPNPTIELRVERRPDHGSVVVTVADDGPGISPAELAVIEGTRSITPLDHCSGLGLWLAKWIVEAYGGEIAFVGPDPKLGGAAVELRLRQPTLDDSTTQTDA